MEWADEAIVLAARPHGERGCIISLLTHEHGRHAGLARGGNTSRMRAVFQPGNLVHARWYSRIAEHLGILSCELLRADAAYLFVDGERLACLAAACATAEAMLPERMSHGIVFATLKALVRGLVEGRAGWAVAYVRWEMTLLAELGYGLDLRGASRMPPPLRGSNNWPAYVSPRTGRVILASESRREGLLRLPFFLVEETKNGAVVPPADIADALRLTGYFLQQHLSVLLPAARERLVAHMVGMYNPENGLLGRH